MTEPRSLLLKYVGARFEGTRLPVDVLSLTKPAASFDLCVGNGMKSRAVFGVSVGQFGTEGIPCHSDPVAATAELKANLARLRRLHWHRTPKAEKKKAQRL